MNRTKQIDEMAKICCGICEYEHCGDCLNDNSCDIGGCYMATHTAERLYNANYRKQEWISVEERLPEKDGKYLVYDVGQRRGASAEEIRIAYFKLGDRYHDYMWKTHFTHWLPLPEIPEMKGGVE